MHLCCVGAAREGSANADRDVRLDARQGLVHGLNDIGIQLPIRRSTEPCIGYSQSPGTKIVREERKKFIALIAWLDTQLCPASR